MAILTTCPPLPTITHRSSQRFSQLTFFVRYCLGAPQRAGELAGRIVSTMNQTLLLSVLVDMTANTDVHAGELDGDSDAVIRELYSHHAKALHGYVQKFCPDRASADDIVQETFIRAWRHLPQLSADDRPVRPWLFRVARNLLIDANRAARARPMTVQEQAAGEVGTDSGLEEILDRQLVSAALQHLSPAHQTVLVETFYRGGTVAMVARELGIPHGTARSRLHYALDALRKQLQQNDAIAVT
jgi:RNA polymerase sigma-70 factor (ECF subfamily)